MAVIWKKVYNFASAKPKPHQYMKQIYRHALLTLLLGATCTTAGATTGDIINEDFSEFAAIVERAGKMDLLSTYGTYTCFAPTNAAVKAYLQSMGLSSIL